MCFVALMLPAHVIDNTLSNKEDTPRVFRLVNERQLVSDKEDTPRVF